MTPKEIVEHNLAAPKKVQVGNQSVELPTLAEQIAAAEFLANATVTPAHSALLFTKIRPGGAA